MGRVRELTEDESTIRTSSSSLSEILLITTMCIVGLPVEVHIKDGSIFSGIFHTASFDKGYGIALKKVRMVKKGTHASNVVNGCLIDTLVVRSGDLVQVLAKGVMLPSESASDDATIYNGGAFPGDYNSFQESDNEPVSSGEQSNQQSHVGMDRSQKEDVYHHASELIKELIEVNHSSTTLNGGHAKLIAHEENQVATVPNELMYGSLAANDTSLNVKLTNQLRNEELIPTKSVASEFSSIDKMGLNANGCSSVVAPPQAAPQKPVTIRAPKESKLNPGAKTFSPSLSNFRSNQIAAPAVSTAAYVPNSIPAVQVAASQSEVGYRPVTPLSSWPVKVVPYVTSAPTSMDNNFQYSQPHVAGHIATRKQPVRHGAVYQPIQAVPSYLHAHHQNGAYSRPGQLLYVHPVTHDVIQGSTLSQAPYPLVTSHPIHVPKHEGLVVDPALHASMAPPLITNGPQPFMMPSHQLQLSSMHPYPVLGPTVPYNARFA